MKIYVLGSNAFIPEMVECKSKLREMGFDASIHPDYEAFVRGERLEILNRANSGGSEHAKVKRENGYFKQHYKYILENDAVLFVNNVKKGISNYIGGNVLIEMGQAYVNDKKIFLLYGMPKGFSYDEEIEAMDPILLNGDLGALKTFA